MAKRPAHRPTKCKPEHNQAIVELFTLQDPYKIIYDVKGKAQYIPVRLPFFEDFAESIGVDDDTIGTWSKVENEKKYPGFHSAYMRAKELQERQIIEGGMVGAYNPQFSIFLAKNITRLRDVSKLEHSGPDGQNFVFKVVNYAPPSDGSPPVS